ncbi:hypothetical protein KHA90_24190 [Flavobacterium psychroterrae]|uniref:Uncharacterized protein n=1 Tax=Flavobacterium psychroterrae TaxID=2133767 RepID=A0ABS5PIF8_9FLAO|nr:hypothetical protein [Flavobacterium psychroterrae]MBS7234109.1 hypothetical protein [Flavobacterium psychroterrae]
MIQIEDKNGENLEVLNLAEAIKQADYSLRNRNIANNVCVFIIYFQTSLVIDKHVYRL